MPKNGEELWLDSPAWKTLRSAPHFPLPPFPEMRIRNIVSSGVGHAAGLLTLPCSASCYGICTEPCRTTWSFGAAARPVKTAVGRRQAASIIRILLSSFDEWQFVFFFSGWVCLPSRRRSVLIAQVFGAFVVTQAGPCRSGAYYCRLRHIPYHLPLFVLIATIPVIKVTGLDLSFVLMTWNRTAARTTS